MAFSRTPCGNEDCCCHIPTLTDPKQALEFLAGRMAFAGMTKSVAESYAQDLEEILAKYEITFQEKP